MQPSKAERRKQRAAGRRRQTGLSLSSLTLFLSHSAATSFKLNSNNNLCLTANSQTSHKRGGWRRRRKIIIESHAVECHSVSIIGVGIRVRRDHAAR